MADSAITQVEDRLKAVLEAYAPLAGQTVITDQSMEVAVTEDQLPAILIYTTGYSVEVADENWMTLHTATVELEAISGTPTIGKISRKNHETIANIVGAIAQDRSLGIGLQDIQEIDVAPSAANGRDVGSASLQCRIQFFTSLNDWFTIT